MPERKGRRLTGPILLRALLGLLLHPNVGGAVVLEHQHDVEAAARGDGLCYASLCGWADQTGRGAELQEVPHQVIRVGETGACWDADLAAAVAALSRLIPGAGAARRTCCPLAGLVAAQQCGGSDAFSGTCANPRVGAACKLLIERGGSALLAETDELIGAEAYVLSSVADIATARRFVAKVRNFHAYARAHGATAEGNPSGGNLYRGLYNIALKSLGAAMKRHPDVRLERVLEYAEPILLPPAHAADPEPERHQWRADSDNGGESSPGSAPVASPREPGQAPHDCDTGGVVQRGPGYCFMDSPGNDLESIAGQVAAGCDLIFFTTGSGSVSNFPFVPTIKIVSTHLRFERMAADMDVDARAGLNADQAARELFDLSLAVASGQATKGEAFGHHQLQIWRAWAGSPAGAGGGAEAASVCGLAVTEGARHAPAGKISRGDIGEKHAPAAAPPSHSSNGDVPSARLPLPGSPARRSPVGASGAGGASQAAAGGSTHGRPLAAAPMAASAARWLHLTCDCTPSHRMLWRTRMCRWGMRRAPGSGGSAERLAARLALRPARLSLRTA
jgi:altronate dehydratase